MRLLVLGLVAAGCAQPVGPARTARARPPAAPSAAELRERSAFLRAWDLVAKDGERAAVADGTVIRRTEGGGILVYRWTKPVAGAAVPDAIIAEEVRARLEAMPDTRREPIDVGVVDGAVTLRGTVAARQQAAEAVRVALGVRGVDQVVSHLRWRWAGR